MAHTTRITGKYQLTLPKQVRDDLRAGVGDRLVFVRGEDGFWRILVVPKDPIAALRLAGKALSPSDFARLHQAYEREVEDAQRD
jgi:AbrB family looped-hinge helix DNA binding protein